MNIVQTYYSYSKADNPIRDTAGFLSSDMNWKSMALSCLLLRKHYGRITLYCNAKVRRLVVDELGIPYDEVVEMPDFMEDYAGSNLWALPKIYTYSRQKEPFIHVDCDWFMFEKLSDSIEKSDLIGQNIEYDDQFYNRRTLEKLISNGCQFHPWVMDEFSREPVLRVINAGILGGNDVDFIQEYVRMIADFISWNLPILKTLGDGFVNSIYEQMFFYLMARNMGKTLGLCTQGDKLSTKFDWIPMDLSHGPKTGYMHLLANLKRRMGSYAFVSSYLDYMAPDISQRITRYCYDNKIAPLVNYPQWDIYSQETLNHQKDKGKNMGVSLPLGVMPQANGSSVQRKEKVLWRNAKRIAMEQKNNMAPLWGIASLWDERYAFGIYPGVDFKEISHEMALKLLSGNQNKTRRLPSLDMKTCLVFVPDASMMKVHKCVVTGIKVEIMKYLMERGEATLHEIGNHLLSRNTACFESRETRDVLDRAVRSMVASNMLRLYLR